jgi:hypothetical protein
MPTAAGHLPRRHIRRAANRHAPLRILIATALLFAPPWPAYADEPLPAGRYTVTARMILPHLDAMRRIGTTTERCIETGNAAALFPVLDQPALRGCALGHETRQGHSADYVLECGSARVATGTAQVTMTPVGVTATLDVKMGGKNMTFRQRIDARRGGPCSAANRASRARSNATPAPEARPEDTRS